MSDMVRRKGMLAAVFLLAASIASWCAAAPVIKVMIADTSSTMRTASKWDEQANRYADYLFAKTGVRVVLDRQPGEGTAYTEKVTLALASGNAPDLIAMGGDDQFCMNVARSGALEQLNSHLGAYRNLSRVYNEDYWKEYSFENKRYVLKGVDISPLASRAVLIRQDWLTKLGLAMPQTVSQLYDTARKFAAARLDGQPVFGLTGRKDFSYFYALSSAFGCPSPDVERGYTYIDKASKKLVFWNTTNAARAYFKEVQRWNREGLLDPELLTSAGGSFWNKIDAGKVGIVCHRAESAGWLSTEIRQAQKRKEPTLVVMPAIKGTGFRNPAGKEGGFEENYAFEGYYGIPKGNKNIANVLKVMDFECSPEFAEFRVFGLEGVEHKVVNGKKVFDKENANLVSFLIDYCFTCDRNALSKDAQDSFILDMSGGGDTTNDYIYDPLADALARTKAAYAAAAAQAVPHQVFGAIVPRLEVESMYPDVKGAYLALYVKMATGELDASKDADWQQYLQGVADAGIPAITAAKEAYLLKNAPNLF